MCAHLQAISEGRLTKDGESPRLLVNVPPGTMKSLLTAVFWPAWEWGPRNQPHLRYLGVAHEVNLAGKHSTLMRRLVTSEWYQANWGDRVQLTRDQNEKVNFENTKGGFRIAVASSSITGRRADRVIIDDPHSVDGAASEALRQNVNENFLEAIPLRLSDPKRSAIVVIKQRLHEDDVSGIILAKGLGYVHLMLPMEFEPKRRCVTGIPWLPPGETKPRPFADPRKVDGELLFPERFPAFVVERDKTVMGRYAVAGQFQQLPAPRGGGLFKHEWWQPWTDEEATKLGVKPGHLPSLSYVLGVIDTAYTKQEENDPCAMVVLGIWKDARGQPQVMLCGAWEDWLEFNPLVEKTAKTCEDFGVDRLLIESKASGISVAQELNRRFSRSRWGLELIDPGKGDKLSRAYAITSIFEGGQVWAPGKVDGDTTKYRSWAEKVIDQMGKFPKDKHDDLTDAVVHGLKYLRDTGMLLRVDEHRHAEADEATYRPPLQPLYPT